MNLIIGIAGSIIAAGIVAIFVRWYRKKVIEAKEKEGRRKIELRLGKTLLDQGLTKFHFSRDDYDKKLASFMDTAVHSISIVSLSLKITDDEGQLADLFKRKLSANAGFNIIVSLINPNNPELIKVAADTLNISSEKLSGEITEMLKALWDCHSSLNDSEKGRFRILVHNCFPMGSVVMLDATPTSGMIQVETKLYRAARTNSFGFQLTKESPFFKHNFVAWNRVIQDSIPISKGQLSKKKNTKTSYQS